MCLIFDSEPYRYQTFCSDIAGQDIRAHNNDGRVAIRDIPGGARIADRYTQFRQDLPAMCEQAGLEVGALIFLDYRTLVVGWLDENPW